MPGGGYPEKKYVEIIKQQKKHHKDDHKPDGA